MQSRDQSSSAAAFTRINQLASGFRVGSSRRCIGPKCLKFPESKPEMAAVSGQPKRIGLEFFITFYGHKLSPRSLLGAGGGAFITFLSGCFIGCSVQLNVPSLPSCWVALYPHRINSACDLSNWTAVLSFVPRSVWLLDNQSSRSFGFINRFTDQLMFI